MVLDTNVLVPIAAANLLLRLAEREFYRPLWSARIMDEVSRTIKKIHVEFTDAQIRDRLVAMNEAFEDALVVGWDQIEPALNLPDVDDRHVLACAIVGGADAIVTNNIDDFPVPVLASFGLEVIGLDEFLLDLIDHDSIQVENVIQEMARDTKKPAITAREVLDAVARAGAPQAANALSPLLRTLSEPSERALR